MGKHFLQSVEFKRKYAASVAEDMAELDTLTKVQIRKKLHAHGLLENMAAQLRYDSMRARNLCDARTA